MHGFTRWAQTRLDFISFGVRAIASNKYGCGGHDTKSISTCEFHGVPTKDVARQMYEERAYG
jgi:hypothetical protein